MADLTEKTSSQTIKIVGADPSTGVETNYADVTSEGELKISSFANVSFISGVKTISTTEVLASVGASNLANRKSFIINNKSAISIFYGPSGVTSTTGIEIPKGATIEFALGENIEVYLVTANNSGDVIIQEFS